MRVLVVAPGRGSYGPRELGTLAKTARESEKAEAALGRIVAAIDGARRALGRTESVRALDERKSFAPELVAGRTTNVVPPAERFLSGLRDLCTARGVLLVFDEVISGFRASRGGAQELLSVRPDLTCLGKIIGGGLPVGFLK